MALDTEQRKIVRHIKAEARTLPKNLQGKFKRYAVEIGIVESNLHNVHYGDADSKNFRQEREQGYGDDWAKTGGPYNTRAIVRRLKDEFLQQYDPGEKSYQVAAQVQRPREDLRGRYHDVAGQAAQVLKGVGGGPPAGPNAPQGPRQGTSPVYRRTPGVDNSGARQELAAQYFANSHDPGALLAYKAGVDQAQDTPGSMELVRPGMQAQPTTEPKASVRQSHGTANFEGHKVAGWIAPALRYARKHGWTGTVNSGFRTDAEQKRIYDSGVRPAAKPKAYGGGGSNHEGSEYPRGAVDVSDPEKLAQILLNSPWRKKLIYAGAKDPVHFSHPHGGSY